MPPDNLSSGLQKKGGKDLFACKKEDPKKSRPDLRKSLIAHVPLITSVLSPPENEKSFESLLRAGVRIVGVPLLISNSLELDSTTSSSPHWNTDFTSGDVTRRPESHERTNIESCTNLDLFHRICETVEGHPELEKMANDRMRELASEMEFMRADMCTKSANERTVELLNMAIKARCNVFGRFANRTTCGVKIACTLPTIGRLQSMGLGTPPYVTSSLPVRTAIAQFRSLANSVQKKSDVILLHASPHDTSDIITTLEIARDILQLPIILVWNFNAEDLLDEAFTPAAALNCVPFESAKDGNYLYCHLLAFQKRSEESTVMFCDRASASIRVFIAAMEKARTQWEEEETAKQHNSTLPDDKIKSVTSTQAKKKKQRSGGHNGGGGTRSAGFGLLLKGGGGCAIEEQPSEHDFFHVEDFKHIIETCGEQHFVLLVPPWHHLPNDDKTTESSGAKKRLTLNTTTTTTSFLTCRS
jgi:hypothetical protein